METKNRSKRDTQETLIEDFHNYDLAHGQYNMIIRLIVVNFRQKDELQKLIDFNSHAMEEHEEIDKKLIELVKKAIDTSLSIDELGKIEHYLHCGADIFHKDKKTNQTIFNLALKVQPKLSYKDASVIQEKINHISSSNFQNKLKKNRKNNLLDSSKLKTRVFF